MAWRIMNDPRIPEAAKADMLTMLDNARHGYNPMAHHKAAEFDVASSQAGSDPSSQNTSESWQELLELVDRMPWTQAEKYDYVRRTRELGRVVEQMERGAQPSSSEEEAQLGRPAATRRP